MSAFVVVVVVVLRYNIQSSADPDTRASAEDHAKRAPDPENPAGRVFAIVFVGLVVITII